MSEFRDYIEQAGWKLCAIDAGRKSPTYSHWNTKPIALDAADGLDGAGLLHALSGTCCIDVDDIDTARAWLHTHDVDIDALLAAPDAVRIDSGRSGRAKLLYKLKKPLRTVKPVKSGFELRCATAEGRSVQDVLPPSIHPTTKKPYQWAYGESLLGHWSSLPSIPPSLFACWRNLIADDNMPIAERAESPTIDLDKLRKAAFKHSPDCEYPEWLRVGMQLHDGTNGNQEGFDLWCEWSRGFKRKQYPGDIVLKTHWLSFTSGPGKHVATGAALAAELPAEADEFPIEPIDATGETSEKAMQETLRNLQKASIEKLEQRLVFVHSAERYFDTERHKLIGSDNAIEHMFTSMMPAKKGGRINPVKVLKASPTKRFVDGMGFHPGEGVIFQDRMGDSYANSYKPQLPEPLEPRPDEIERIEWLFNRIDDPIYRQWLMQFYAHVIQKPGVKIKSAPLIWSETQGNGKTTLLRMIPMLLVGPRYSREVTSSQLNDMFNGYLLDAWHINLTEFRAGSRGEREAISKKVESWIADDAVAVRPMHQTAYTMPNHFFITGSSNSEDAAAIGNQDRKWGIHELHAPQFTEAEQTWIYRDFLLTNRAPGVLRQYFLQTDITGFFPSAKAPETVARQEMVDSSISSDLELLQTAWEQRTEPLNRDIVSTSDVTDYVRRHSLSKPSSKRVGRMLCKPPFNGVSHRWRAGKAEYRGVILQNVGFWQAADGHKIMAHIAGNDKDLTT